MRKIFTILLLFTSCISYAQVNMTLGLQAYYPFTGNANDASGNNNNAAFNNASPTSDKFGNANSAYHFNGSTSYIRVPASASLNTLNQISMCAWVRPTGFYTGPCHGNSIFEKGGTFLMRFDDAIYTNWNNCANPTVDLEHQLFYGPLTAQVPVYTPFIQAGEWYSVVYTYDGSTIRVYVNCELKITLAATGLNFSTVGDLFFGHTDNSQFPYWLNGDLDELRIYNRALNQDEITVYGNCSVAPVTITSFNAAPINNKAVKLVWDTEAEFNIRDYSIERSSTGNAAEFSSLGTVISKSNSRSNQYTYTDNSAKPNSLYYYRLAIHDLDGTKKYSPVRTARITNNDFYTVVYPNPTSGNIKVIVNNSNADVSVTVTNLLGETIATKKSSEANSNSISLDLGAAAKGIYWVIIQSGSDRTVEKIIKQ